MTWSTSEESDSLVEYGTTASYGSLVSSSELVTEHSLSISGLSAFTTYHFRITSETSGGEQAISDDETFTTLDNPPTNNIFYAAPDGSSVANGAFNSPWDLETALGHPAAVEPGATIYLRGGTYTFDAAGGQLGYTSTLTGSAEEPITVRSYPGEWAVIDGNVEASSIKNTDMLAISGDYTWYRDFEMTNSETGTRKIDVSGSNPTERRGNAIDDRGSGNRIINLIIHDTGQGIGAWQNGQDGEYYGNIIYHNGWDAPDRGHGKCLYTQNESGYKRFQNNICWNDFSGITLRTGGTDDSAVVGYLFEGNIFFNGGVAMQGPDITGMKIFKNYTYNHNFKVGHEPDNSSYNDAEVRYNYFADQVQLFDFFSGLVFKNNTVMSKTPNSGRTINTGDHPELLSIDNNVYYNTFPDTHPYWAFKSNGLDYAFNKTQGNQVDTYAYIGRSWQDDLGFDLNSTFHDDQNIPTENAIFYRKNKYDPDLLYIYVYNWAGDNSVSIDPSLVLDSADSYSLRSAQDYFDDVTTGTYSGSAISVAMTGRTFENPIGYDEVVAGGGWYHDPLDYGTSTFPTFGSFVLENTSGTTDTAGPVISGVTSDTITDTSATIRWDTNEDATTVVDYGTSNSYGSTSSPDDGTIYGTFYTTTHQVTLSGLTSGTTYHYRLTSVDYAGNETGSTDYTFTTTGTAPAPSSNSAASSGPPICNDAKPNSAPWLYGASSRGNDSILLQFTEAGNPVSEYAVEFGTESGKYQFAAASIGGKGTTNYLVQSLAANTTYYFRVRGGNGCATGDWSNEISATTKGRFSIFTTGELDTGSIEVDTKKDGAEVGTEKEMQTEGACQIYIVQSGDTLSSISQKLLGNGSRYSELVDLNKDRYPSLETNPASIGEGWELIVSCSDQGEDQESMVERAGYNVNIKVIDENKEAVLGAIVTLHSTPRETETNEDGIAYYENVESGEHRVVIAYNGQTGEQIINIPENSDVEEIDFTIQIKTTSPFLNPWVMGVIGILSLAFITVLIMFLRSRASKPLVG